jgi:hypothetical protein
MRSEKQIQASKANGARSRGPITAEGKRKSSRNSIRHGLLAQAVVLEVESAGRFQELLAAFMDEYQPRTESQISLVETMAVARWRQFRVWRAQKTALGRAMVDRSIVDHGVAGQDPSVGSRSARALRAWLVSPESWRLNERLLRYELAFDRQFSRALTNLLALRSGGQKPEEKNICKTNPGAGVKTKGAPLKFEAF